MHRPAPPRPSAGAAQTARDGKTAPPQELRCESCGRSFKSNKHLGEHRRVAAKYVAHKSCELCNVKFCTIELYKKHVRAKHWNPNLFHCDKCDGQFSKRYKLNVHQKAFREGSVRNVCPICRKTFCSIAELCEHQQVHAGEYYQQKLIAGRLAAPTRRPALSRRPIDFQTTGGAATPPPRLPKNEDSTSVSPRLSVNTEQRPEGENLSHFTCKYCNGVFAGFEALLSHLDSHLNGNTNAPPRSTKTWSKSPPLPAERTKTQRECDLRGHLESCMANLADEMENDIILNMA